MLYKQSMSPPELHFSGEKLQVVQKKSAIKLNASVPSFVFMFLICYVPFFSPRFSGKSTFTKVHTLAMNFGHVKDSYCSFVSL